MKIIVPPAKRYGSFVEYPTLADAILLTDDDAPITDVVDLRITAKPGEPVFAWCEHIVSEATLEACETRDVSAGPNWCSGSGVRVDGTRCLGCRACA